MYLYSLLAKVGNGSPMGDFLLGISVNIGTIHDSHAESTRLIYFDMILP